MSNRLRGFDLRKWVFSFWVLAIALVMTLNASSSSKGNLATRTSSASTSSAAPPFVEFESGQVRPIAMSADRSKLFAVNTPNGTLEIFNITPDGLALQSRVPVGLEPVAVAAPNDSEVWASFASKALGGVTTECDLVANVAQGGVVRGFLYDPVAGNFIPSDGSPRISDSALRALASTPGQEVTYTCVPPGSGARIALN